ncbi:MAG: HesA/MoeB/ThiF family protein [Candidatus Izemoplasmataceae bacterium]
MKQFEANFGIITEADFELIKTRKIIIIGLGGLGGMIANGLVRMGFHHLTLIDFDRFEESNLNRQLFSNFETIGSYKVDVVKKELLKINPNAMIHLIKESVYDVNKDVFTDGDLIIDAVDKIQTKVYLEALASLLDCPLLHGAIGGWYGQIGIVLPKTYLLKALYHNNIKGLEDTLKNPAFTPGVIANMMVLECVKFFIKPEDALINQILSVDLLNHDYHVLIKRGDTNG